MRRNTVLDPGPSRDWRRAGRLVMVVALFTAILCGIFAAVLVEARPYVRPIVRTAVRKVARKLHMHIVFKGDTTDVAAARPTPSGRGGVVPESAVAAQSQNAVPAPQPAKPQVRSKLVPSAKPHAKIGAKESRVQRRKPSRKQQTAVATIYVTRPKVKKNKIERSKEKRDTLPQAYFYLKSSRPINP